MKPQTIVQIIIAIVLAAALSFLFLNSQIDRQQHLQITKTLLKLKEHDLQLNQGIVQNQSGLHKNFDFISFAQRNVNKQISQARQKLSGASTRNEHLNSELRQLTKIIDAKLALVERYKQLAALNKMTKRYLPTAYKSLVVAVAQTNNLEDKDQRLIINQAKRIHLGINRYIAGYATPEKKLQDISLSLLDKGALLNKETNDKLAQFINYFDALLKTTKDLSLLVDEIRNTNSIQRIDNLHTHYVSLFEKNSQLSKKYKSLLFAMSMLLLIYLSVVFVRLQNTGKNLEETLTHLEFRKAALDLHAIVSITDVKGDIIYANDKFCEISKYSRKEVLNQNHRILKSNEHDDQFYREMWKTVANGKVWHGEICNLAKDGSKYWVSSTIVPRINNKGKPYEYIGMRTDITAQKIAEKEVAALARFPLENPEPVLRVSVDGYVTFHNDAASVLLQHWNTSLNHQLPTEWVQQVREIFYADTAKEIDVSVDAKHFLLSLAPVKDEEYINIYARDITARKRAEESLSYQATHDSLTDLVNRYAFENELEHAVANAKTNYKQHILLYIDLDQFKIVNDTCGHVAGDELLRQLSHLMLSIFRENDTLARLGGDEFGVLLSNCNLSAGEKIAKNLLDLINDYRFMWEEQPFEIGASIGLVEINQDSESSINILGQADVACYGAKDAGRNRINIYKDDEESAQRQSELHWASRIPQALDEDRFRLMVQTITPLHDDHTLHAHHEILVRMVNENGEFIPPGAFIPAAERYNLMQAIDQWVVSHAFTFLEKFVLEDDLENMPCLAVNLSGDSMGNNGLLNYIREQITVKKIPAKNISFEVTETAAIGNLNSAIKFINSLKELGCEFALDDFGSGLSSFAYLKNMPVDYLKIDGAFVKDMIEDPIDAAMVDAINQVGHIMGIKTIAEFVENQEIMDALSDLGVDYAQGYHINKPTPLEEAFPIKRDST